MKKIISLFLIAVSFICLNSCSKGETEETSVETTTEIIAETVDETAETEKKQKEDSLAVQPNIVQMRSICELATMECYSHHVTKFTQEDAAGHLWWKKDKEFWIEYDCITTVGINASLIEMKIIKNNITITIPEAKILSCNMDKDTEALFYVAKNSANITAEDEKIAFTEAEKEVIKKIEEDKYILPNALERAKTLLEDYITNLGNVIGQPYTIEWVYLDAEGNPL